MYPTSALFAGLYYLKKACYRRVFTHSKLMTPSYTCLIEHKFAYITDIIVENKYKKQGIGSALLLEA
ncbi:hypothetical protein BFO01nite_30000 [Brevibacillus formosus]|uniref:N-acetyltransferase domain-containing protein n=1 Tax=Brevibacillus formosus TaxID=54913 RepID=A0ABQ0TCM3_9BACL|nr:hypothetical protein BFO01nite_30000 [Brevibacillus formosus]